MSTESTEVPGPKPTIKNLKRKLSNHKAISNINDFEFINKIGKPYPIHPSHVPSIHQDNFILSVTTTI